MARRFRPLTPAARKRLADPKFREMVRFYGAHCAGRVGRTAQAGLHYAKAIREVQRRNLEFSWEDDEDYFQHNSDMEESERRAWDNGDISGPYCVGIKKPYTDERGRLRQHWIAGPLCGVTLSNRYRHFLRFAPTGDRSRYGAIRSRDPYAACVEAEIAYEALDQFKPPRRLPRRQAPLL